MTGKSVLYPESLIKFIRTCAISWPSKEDIAAGYKNGMDKSKNLVHSLPRDCSMTNFASLIGLLEEFTSSMAASSYNCYPNSSLYDHLFTTGTIANALFGAAGERGVNSESELSELLDSGTPFRLVQGDFGGIQDLLFRHSVKLKSMQLKFYALGLSKGGSMITQTAARLMCDEFECEETAIIMNVVVKAYLPRYKL